MISTKFADLWTDTNDWGKDSNVATETTAIKALAGATLIDGHGGEPVQDAVVVVSGSKIDQAGPRDQVKIPEGAKVIDIGGKTVMPGMFDCHTHLSSHTLDIVQRLFTHKTVEKFKTAATMKRVLRSGITTVRDAGGLDPGFRQAVDMGLIEGPRLLVAGYVGQTGGHLNVYFPSGVEIELGEDGSIICDGVADVQKVTRKQLRGRIRPDQGLHQRRGSPLRRTLPSLRNLPSRSSKPWWARHARGKPW